MKIFLFLIILLCGVIYAEGPLFQHRDTYGQQEFQNVYKNIREIGLTTNARGGKCLDDPTFCVDFSSKNVRMGFGPIVGATATVSAGGSLSANTTYWYKVWPYDQNGMLGFTSPEMKMLTTASDKTVTVSWDLLPGASYYRVSQGTGSNGQGGPDGWWETTGLTYTDSGQAYSDTRNISGLQRYEIYMPGQFILHAGMSGFTFKDWVTGNNFGFGPTSAGEWTFESGTGDAEGFYYLYDGSGNLGLLIETHNTAGISFGNGSRMGYLAGSEIRLVVNDLEKIRINASSIAVHQPLYVTPSGGLATTTTPFEIRATTNSTVNLINLRNGPGDVTAGMDYGFGWIMAPRNLSSIRSYAIASTGTYFYCPDCTVDTFCISTGTAVGSWAGNSSARTNPCQ